MHGGRWNRIGDPMLYFSQNLSLSLLEIIVHVEYAELPMDYSYLEAEIPDSSLKKTQSIQFIQPNWRTEGAVQELQLIGSNWLKKEEGLTMQVPSAILPQENNILINPKHKDIHLLKVIKIEKLELDPRLFRT